MLNQSLMFKIVLSIIVYVIVKLNPVEGNLFIPSTTLLLFNVINRLLNKRNKKC